MSTIISIDLRYQTRLHPPNHFYMYELQLSLIIVIWRSPHVAEVVYEVLPNVSRLASAQLGGPNLPPVRPFPLHKKVILLRAFYRAEELA